MYVVYQDDFNSSSNESIRTYAGVCLQAVGVEGSERAAEQGAERRRPGQRVAVAGAGRGRVVGRQQRRAGHQRLQHAGNAHAAATDSPTAAAAAAAAGGRLVTAR